MGLFGRLGEMVGNLRPQELFAALRIFIETLAVFAALAVELLDKLDNHVVGRAAGIGIAQILFGLAHDLVGQLQGNFIGHRQRPDHHARQAPGVLNKRRLDAVLKHRRPLHDVGSETAAGVKPTAVVDHDRRLFDRCYIIKGPGQRLVPGLFAEDDLDQRHFLDRGEEMDADEPLGVAAGLGQPGDRQGRGIRGHDAVFADHRLGLPGHVGLDLAVLEHRLDHQIAAFKIAVFRGRVDAPEERLALFFGRLVAFYALFDQLFRMGLALLGRLEGAVQKHHLHAAPGRDIGDPGPHHTGPQHAELANRLFLLAFGPLGAPFGGQLVDEKRTDHIGCHRAGHQIGKTLRIEPDRGIERHDRAFVDRRQDRLDGRIIVPRLVLGHGRGADQGAHRVGVHGAAAAGDLETPFVPRLLSDRLVEKPGLGGLQELVLGDDGVGHF